MVVFDNDKDFVIIFDFFQKLFYIIFCHPTAEDIRVILAVFHPGSHLTDVKVLGEFLQTVFRCNELWSSVRKHLSGFFI